MGECTIDAPAASKNVTSVILPSSAGKAIKLCVAYQSDGVQLCRSRMFGHKSYWTPRPDRNFPFRPPVVSRAVVNAACEFVRQSGIGFAWPFERGSGIGLESERRHKRSRGNSAREPSISDLNLELNWERVHKAMSIVEEAITEAFAGVEQLLSQWTRKSGPFNGRLIEFVRVQILGCTFRRHVRIGLEFRE